MSGEQLGNGGDEGYPAKIPDLTNVWETDVAEFLETPEGETALSRVLEGSGENIATTWAEDGTMQSEDLGRDEQPS